MRYSRHCDDCIRLAAETAACFKRIWKQKTFFSNAELPDGSCENEKAEGGEEGMTKEFGSCCVVLHDAMTHPPNSLFRVDGGVLYLAVGYSDTEGGIGWFEQAVLFCPFCGTALQTKDEIATRHGL